MPTAPFKNYLLSALLGAIATGIAALALYRHELPKNRDISNSSPPSALAAKPVHVAAVDMTAGKAESIEVLVEGLRQRLQKQPDDVNGWVLLGRSYHFLQRWDDAEAAFAKAKSLGYQGDADTAPVGAENADVDPVFAGVAEAVQRQAGQLQTPPANDKSASSKSASSKSARSVEAH